MRPCAATFVLLGLVVGGAQIQDAEAQVRPAALAVTPLSQGVLAAGDTVEVQPSWRNDGTGATGWMTGSAVAANGGTIQDGTASYGVLESGTTASCAGQGDCYSLTVSGPRQLRRRAAQQRLLPLRRDAPAQGRDRGLLGDRLLPDECRDA
jgi:hypothetical protein